MGTALQGLGHTLPTTGEAQADALQLPQLLHGEAAVLYGDTASWSTDDQAAGRGCARHPLAVGYVVKAAASPWSLRVSQQCPCSPRGSHFSTPPVRKSPAARHRVRTTTVNGALTRAVPSRRP